MGAGIGAGVSIGAHRYLTHRPAKEIGLADRLPWALLVSEGVILNKDATFMAGFQLRGGDLTSAPAESLNLAAQTINQLITQMAPGYSLEVNIHRTSHGEYPCSQVQDFPTEILRDVDAERQRHFTLPGTYYETHHTLIINFTPPRESVRKIEGMFVKGSQSINDYGMMLENFQHTLDEVQGYLSPSFEIHRLSSEGLVTECHRCLSGDDTRVIPDGGYICYALASGDIDMGFIPRFNDHFVYAVTISSFGPSVEVASGDFFNSLRDDCRWHMRYLPLSRAQSESKLKAIQRNWFSKRQGPSQFMPGGGGEDSAAMEDPHAKAMQEETAEALGDVTSGVVRFGYLSNTILIRDHDMQRGRVRAQTILQRARESGFVGLIETMNAPSAMMGSLPGMGAANLRRLLVVAVWCLIYSQPRCHGLGMKCAQVNSFQRNPRTHDGRWGRVNAI